MTYLNRQGEIFSDYLEVIDSDSEHAASYS